MVKVKFVGKKPDWMDAMLSEFNLADNCHFYGKVPQKEGLEILESFDACLCTSVKVHGGEDYALASKTFDYILKHKPIIGFTTKGAQREFIAKSGMGFICDPDNIEDSAAMLEKVILGGISLKPDMAYIKPFNRENRAAEMAAIVKGIISHNNS